MKNSSYICGEIVGIDPPMTKRYQASFSSLFCLVLLNSLVMENYFNIYVDSNFKNPNYRFPNEEFKSIPGYEESYSISNYGRVRSDAGMRWSGKGFAYFKNRILVPQLDHLGYYRLGLHKNKLHKNHLVHRLVAYAFLGDTYKKTVNHKNGIKVHNFISNLEWATSSENQKHAYKTGLKKPHIGINNPGAKLTDDKVIQIREMLKTGMSQERIAKHFNVGHYAIYRIASKKGWTHVK